MPPAKTSGLYEDSSFRFHGFLLNEGIYTTIDVPGATYTVAYGINAAGQIVAPTQTSAPAMDFFWKGDLHHH